MAVEYYKQRLNGWLKVVASILVTKNCILVLVYKLQH